MMKLIFTQVVILIFISATAYSSEEVATIPSAAAAAVVGVKEKILLAQEAAPVAMKPIVSENEIPLNVEVTKKSVETASTSTRLLLTGMILFVILGSSYYFVRKYKLSNNINKSNKQIKVISQHYLGPKKSLAIIHVAGESILIGVTDSNISMIKSLSLIDDEVPAELPQNFSDTLQLKNRSQAAAGASVRQQPYEELEEEFSFAGVKDSVSKKIKSMRNFS